ncbi:MAG: hypothetical protein LIO49_05990 [Ruminococcus sp.]|nr:hypothetical protein [Ruminococcus sp.]
MNNNRRQKLKETVRRAKAEIAFNSMRVQATESGFMSDEEIEAEIKATREAMESSKF